MPPSPKLSNPSDATFQGKLAMVLIAYCSQHCQWFLNKGGYFPSANTNKSVEVKFHQNSIPNPCYCIIIHLIAQEGHIFWWCDKHLWLRYRLLIFYLVFFLKMKIPMLLMQYLRLILSSVESTCTVAIDSDTIVAPNERVFLLGHYWAQSLTNCRFHCFCND
jgi:hypothetical protein